MSFLARLFGEKKKTAEIAKNRLSLLIAHEQLAAGVDAAFMKAKIATARFYADHLLTRVPGQRDAVVEGADSVTALALEGF